MERLLAPLDSFLMNYSINRQFEGSESIIMKNKQSNKLNQQSNTKNQSQLINVSCHTLHDLNLKLGQIINFQSNNQQNSSICTVSSLQTIQGDQNSFANLSKFLKFCDQKLRQKVTNKVSSKQEIHESAQPGSQTQFPSKNNKQVSSVAPPQTLMNQISSKTVQLALQEHLQNYKDKGKLVSQGVVLPAKQFNQQQQSNIQNIGSLSSQQQEQYKHEIHQQQQQQYQLSQQQQIQQLQQQNQNQQQQQQSTARSINISKNSNITPSTNNDVIRAPSQSLYTPAKMNDSDNQTKAIQQRIQEQINLQKDLYLNKLITSQKSSSKTPETQQLSGQNIPQLQLNQDQINAGSSTARNENPGNNSAKNTLELKRNKSQQLEQMKKLNSQRNSIIQKQQEKEMLKKLFGNKQKPSNIFSSGQETEFNENINWQPPSYPQLLYKQTSSGSTVGSSSNNNVNNNQTTLNQSPQQQQIHQQPSSLVPPLSIPASMLGQNEILSNKLASSQPGQIMISNKLNSQNMNNEGRLLGKRSDSVHQNPVTSSNVQHNHPLYTSRNHKNDENKGQSSPLGRPHIKSVHTCNSPQRQGEYGNLKSFQKQIYNNPQLQIMNNERLIASRNHSKHLSPSSPQQQHVNSNTQTLNTQGNIGGWSKPQLTQEYNHAKTQVTQHRGPPEGPEELKNLYFQLQKKQQQIGLRNQESNKENSKMNSKAASSMNKETFEIGGTTSPQASGQGTLSTYIIKARHKSYHQGNSVQQQNQVQLHQSSQQIGSGSPSSVSCKPSPYMKSLGMPSGQSNNFTSSSNGLLGKNSTGITNGGGFSKQGSLSQRTSFVPSSRDNSNLRMSQNDTSRNQGNDGLPSNNSVFLNVVNENGQYMKLSDGFVQNVIGSNQNEDRTIPKKLHLNLNLLQQRNNEQQSTGSYRLVDDKKKADTHRSMKQGSSLNNNSNSNKLTTSSNKIPTQSNSSTNIQNKQPQKSFSTHHSRVNSNKGIEQANKAQLGIQKQNAISRVNSSKQLILQNNMPNTILMTEYSGKNQPDVKINSNFTLGNTQNNNSNFNPQGILKTSSQLMQTSNNNYNGILNTEVQSQYQNDFITPDLQQYTIQSTLPTQPNTVGGFLTDRTHYSQNVKKKTNTQTINQQQIKQTIKNQIKGVSEIPTNGFTKPQKNNQQYEQYLQQQMQDIRKTRQTYKTNGTLAGQGSNHIKTKSDISGGSISQIQLTNNFNYQNQTKITLNTRITEPNISGAQQPGSRQNSIQSSQQASQYIKNQVLNTERSTLKTNSNNQQQQQRDIYFNGNKQNGSFTNRIQSAQKTQPSPTPQNIKNQNNGYSNQNVNPYAKILVNNYAGNYPSNSSQKLAEFAQQNLQKKISTSPRVQTESIQGGFGFNEQMFSNIQHREQKLYSLHNNINQQQQQQNQADQQYDLDQNYQDVF